MEPEKQTTQQEEGVRGSLDPSQREAEPEDDRDPYTIRKEWEENNPPPQIRVAIDPGYLSRFIQAYSVCPEFRKRWENLGEGENATSHNPAHRFFKDENHLLFFRNASMQPRLCVPKDMRLDILKQVHNSPYETAHANKVKLWQILSGKFFWRRMKVDIEVYCKSCDTCQKTKYANFDKFGLLIPNPIPLRPYQSVSLDLIVNLPYAEGYNAILVIVDRLSKHAQFIATVTSLTTAEFAELFVKYVICRFGLPDDLVADRDTRWTSDFWREIAKFLRLHLSLSSSHHPQHDGQTEIVNKRLEVMLRAYVQGNLKSWPTWLHLLEHAYNATPQSSTRESPFLVLYGFEPKTISDYLLPSGDKTSPQADLIYGRDVQSFIATFQMHRESARNAIALAQIRQIEAYNKGRKEPSFKDGDEVLINPHSLEWVESKGEGAKLVQRAIGPFTVRERINPKVYRLEMPGNYPGSNVINVQHLRKYQRSGPEFGDREMLPETRWLAPAQELYEVERIIAHDRRRLGKRKVLMFLVRWKDYPASQDTWEPESHLANARVLLREYKRRNGL